MTDDGGAIHRLLAAVAESFGIVGPAMAGIVGFFVGRERNNSDIRKVADLVGLLNDDVKQMRREFSDRLERTERSSAEQSVQTATIIAHLDHLLGKVKP